MRVPILLACLGLLAATSPAVAPSPDPALLAAVNGEWRLPADRARDVYRHPAETLTFFDVHPGQTVIELYPSGGWYMRILAPLEANAGHYVAAVPATPKAVAQATDLFRQNAQWFGHPELVAWQAKTQAAPASPPELGAPASDKVEAGTEFAPPGTADRILTFRNIHNLLAAGAGDGEAPAFFAAAFRALKHGGVLGVEEHRLPENMDAARERTIGYVKKSTIVRLATAAGFRPPGESEINANPADTHDWPKGVWTLPPTYALGDENRAKYAAVGESDRLTLRFVKP